MEQLMRSAPSAALVVYNGEQDEVATLDVVSVIDGVGLVVVVARKPGGDDFGRGWAAKVAAAIEARREAAHRG